MPADPRVAGYRQLVERYGADRVATAILTKWVLDPAGIDQFARLVSHVYGYVPPKRLTMTQRLVLWHLSNGLTQREVAEQMGVEPGTVKQHLKEARGRLGLRHASRDGMVAIAIRTGEIE